MTIQKNLLLIWVLSCLQLFGQFEEPYNLIYGTITGNGIPITSADTSISVEVRKTADGVALASYSMGNEESLGDYYRVKVPILKNDGTQPSDRFLIGETVFIVVRESSQDLAMATHVIEERGVPVRIDFGFTGVCTQSAAGSDQVVCGDSTTLEANSPEVGTGSWQVVLGDSGLVSNPMDPNTSFSGRRGETYILQWIIHDDVLLDTLDEVCISFVAEVTADAGSDQVVCTTDVQLKGNDPSYGTGTWTILDGSSGTFENTTNPSTIFHGLEGHSYQLQWAFDNGPCNDSQDLTQIQIMSPPDAGANQLVCGVSTQLNAKEPVFGRGNWYLMSGVGGTFDDPGSPITFFRGAEGMSYQLAWIVEGTYCQVQDTVQITFSPFSCDVFAENSIFCEAETPTQLAAQVQCGTPPYTYNWYLISGPMEGGTFSDAGIPNPVFTPYGTGVFELMVVVEDHIGTTIQKTKQILAPETDVDGVPGLTQDDFLFRVCRWNTEQNPPVDIDGNGILDVCDLILVEPCYE